MAENRRESIKLTPYNVVGVLDSIRDKYNDKLTERERTALIIAANIVLTNKESTEKEIKKHI